MSDEPNGTDIIVDVNSYNVVETRGLTTVVCSDCGRSMTTVPAPMRGLSVMLNHCGCRDVFQDKPPRALADSISTEGEE